MSAAIKIAGLGVRLGEKQVLSELDLEIPFGQTTVLIGPSGCGKTTLLRALAGWVPVEHGVIEPQLEMADIGVLFQDYHLLPWHTVEKNMRLALGAGAGGIFGSASTEARELVGSIAEQLEIADLLPYYPHQISGGQRQRVALGQLLVKRPKWLLLDEPTSALDAFTKEMIQDLLVEVQQHFGVSLIMVTHSIEEAAFLGQHVAVMKAGRVVEQLANPLAGTAGYRREAAYFEQQLLLRRALGGVG